MRIVHTADVHLDACFSGAGMTPSYGNRRRQGLRDVFQRIVSRAGEWPADALLIAGDLFEHEHVTRDTVAFLQRAFASISDVLVCIAPGNHDPCVPDSPYLTESWPENVHIFREARWTAVEHPSLPLTIHGFAFDGPDISQNPFGALRVPTDGRTHVAVGHGSERSRQPAEKRAYAPFDAPSATAPGLSYLALGHFHAATRLEAGPGVEVWYPGTPQGSHFGEQGPRGYLEVELTNGAARVSAASASVLEFHTLTVDCSGLTSSQELLDHIRSWAGNHACALAARITLEGTAPVSLTASLGGVRDALNGAFEYLSVVDHTVPEEDFEALAQDHTALGLFVARLNEEIRETQDDARRAMLERARTLGVSAYRGVALPVPGLEDGA